MIVILVLSMNTYALMIVEIRTDRYTTRTSRSLLLLLLVGLSNETHKKIDERVYCASDEEQSDVVLVL
jgi:hypothetical protein